MNELSADGLKKREFLQAVKNGSKVEVFFTENPERGQHWLDSTKKTGWYPLVKNEEIQESYPVKVAKLIEHFGIEKYRLAKEESMKFVLRSKVSTPAGFVIPNILTCLSRITACDKSEDIITKCWVPGDRDHYYYQKEELDIIDTSWDKKTGKYIFTYKFIKGK